MPRADSSSAVNRFGLGARPGETAQAGDARGWLTAQLRRTEPTALQGLPTSIDYLRQEAAYLQQRRQMRESGADAQQMRAVARDLYRQSQQREQAARWQLALATPAGFAERLVRFWSNHFAVSVDKRAALLYAAPMEREAIRPNAFGDFAGLLLAVETHPAMLRYLDNARSTGADSRLAQRARERDAKRAPGLNENLAREILELHTLGADAGYTQSDVTELARAITGWGVPRPQELDNGRARGAFVFRPAAHEPGARTLLGRRYGEDGVAQGEAALRALAVHPATARHLSLKLARHFVADDPPVALVDAMSAAWTKSGGQLVPVYRALIDAPQAWDAQARKFKRPEDFLVSALRALGDAADDVQAQRWSRLLAGMGQPAFTPRSPAGYADNAAEWHGPDALFKRIQAAQIIADSVAPADVDALRAADDTLSPAEAADTVAALRRAESPRAAAALLFASPAFQWRV